MGFAILWIIFFHTEMQQLPFILSAIKKQGFGGTDIFLFLSGFGLYYSLKKDDDPMRFYKRRCEHIFPSYIPFILISFAGMIFISIRSGDFNLFEVFQAFCGNFSFLGRFNELDHQTNWYMPTIIWFYIFTPLFYHLITDYTEKKRTASIFFLFIFIIIVNITFLNNNTVLIAFSRLFVFILGLLFADLKERNINDRVLISLAIISLVIGVILVYINHLFFPDKLKLLGLGWYPYVLIAPSLTILLSCIFSILDSNLIGQKVNLFFSFIGKTSFEIYLFHVFFFPLVTAVFDKISNIMWVGLAFIGIVGGIVYYYVINYAKKFINKRLAS